MTTDSCSDNYDEGRGKFVRLLQTPRHIFIARDATIPKAPRERHVAKVTGNDLKTNI